MAKFLSNKRKRALAWLVTMNRLVFFLRNQFATIREDPIIVLGNEKSGTSAIAHLVADFGGLSKTIDIPVLWAGGIEIMCGRSDFASIVRRHRFYFATALLKEPMMTFFADDVLRVFPMAQYVFVVRDPRDNIRSLLNIRGFPGHLEELEDEHLSVSPLHRNTVDPTLWGGGNENYVGVLAHRWNKAVDSYFRHQDRMLLARYEDFVVDKYKFVAKLADQLGLPEKNDISDKLDIQYQPRGDRYVSWEVFFERKNLMCIERICEGRMKEVGYCS